MKVAGGSGRDAREAGNCGAESSEGSRRTSPTKLIVLDLNGLLIHREKVKSKGAADMKRRCGTQQWTKVGMFVVWKRPYLEEFIEFCLEHFDVAVFSSVRPHNIAPLIDLVFGERKQELVFVWDQTKCTTFGRDPDNKMKPLFIKPLGLILEAFPQYSADSVLIVDDSPYKCLRNPPNTAIHPIPWDPSQTDDGELLEGAALRRFLTKLSVDAGGVPALVESGEFGGMRSDAVHADILAQLDAHFRSA